MSNPETGSENRKWQALTREQRRVAGVLAEKSKTTPDVYPMTVNSLTNGANQKSNRSPLMTLSSEHVESVLDQLRELHVVVEIHGDGRAIKYKHLLYDWLGVDKVEMAVMTELLLRGHQTLGELRQRASRMEPIEDLDRMKELVDGLVARDLMIELTPAGRGQVVSHNLYGFDELKKIRATVQAGVAESDDGDEVPAAATRSSAPAQSSDLENRVAELERIVGELTNRLDRIES
jgi:uncharacterized protein YceH (UPF0502 family)